MLPTARVLLVDVPPDVLDVLVVDDPPIPPKPDDPLVPPPKPLDPVDPAEPDAPGPAPVVPACPGALTKVKVKTSEMTLKFGTTERRTKRRSAETTAATDIETPEGTSVISG